jgi:hypothetical protein
MASALDYCPANCGDDAIDLPDIVTTLCKSVGVDLIDKVFFTEADAPGFSTSEYASAPSRTTAWAARLQQTGTKTVAGYTGNAAIRSYEVYDAQKPFVEPTLVTAFGGKQFKKKSDRTIDFVDYDNSEANHAWHNTMNCFKLIRVWFTAGGFEYGGKDGIIMSFASWHGIIESTDKPAEGWTGRLGYSSLLEPPKVARTAIL